MASLCPQVLTAFSVVSYDGQTLNDHLVPFSMRVPVTAMETWESQPSVGVIVPDMELVVVRVTGMLVVFPNLVSVQSGFFKSCLCSGGCLAQWRMR